MKLSFILFLTLFFHVQAETGYAQKTKISLDMKAVSILEVMEEIEATSEFRFFYSKEELNLGRKVDIRVKKQSVRNVLEKLFVNSGMDYEITGKHIVLKKSKLVPLSSDRKGADISQIQEGITVEGIVTSAEDGQPLPGVAVVVVGTTTGVSTDFDGKYSIEVPDEKSVLEFTYIGMVSQQVTVGAQTTVNIAMETDVGKLDEVVVVAFGEQKKESVVASITTINPSELKVPSSNLTTALAGRIAGVISYQRSGEPGQDNADFFIRGVTTFGAGKANPLILIDGVELTTEDLARLNTDDIATFSIMKDANATALYGARGANGVILITTKEGVEGKAKFSFRVENSMSAPVRDVELAGPITYMLMHNESVRTRNPLGIIPYSNEKIAKTGIGNPYVYPVVDWQNMLFKDHTFNQRVNMNINGGGKVARYYVAANFNQDNGVLNVDKRNNFNNNIDLKKYLLRSNVNINVTESTEMVVRLHATFDDYTGPLDGGSGLYNKVMRSNPVLFPAYFKPDAANEFTEHILFGNDGTASLINPYADMVKGYKDFSRTLMLAQFELNQDLGFLLDGLSFKGMFNTNRTSYFDVSRFYNPFYYRVGTYDKYEDTYKLEALNPTEGTEYLGYNEGEKRVTSVNYYQGSLQYNKEINDSHNVSGLLVFTAREERRANAGDLQLSLPYRNLGLAGRLTYAYSDKYFVEGNFGYNGSERFAKNERFGFFPSVGLGYVISNEQFFEPFKEVVSNLKLRATYGLVGNDQIGSDNDRFFYLSNVNLNDGDKGISFGTDYGYNRNGVSISRYSDPFITWERAFKQNYGLEFELFNKLQVQAEYFIENRKNILQARASIPTTMGLQANPQSNIGEARGAGVDIALNYQQQFNNDFWLSVQGNFTYASSKYTVFEEPAYLNSPWRLKTGQKLGQNYGLIAERLFIDEGDVANSPEQQFGEYGAGDIKYKDINYDGIIDDQDKVPIGYPTSPEIIYGAGFSLGYHGFDLSAFFQGSARSSFWIDANNISPFIDTDEDDGVQSNNALLQVIADSYWSEENRNPYAFWPRLGDRQIDNNTQTSTWFMRNGSFVRLKTMEFGYTLPTKFSERFSIDMLRFYVSGTNLLTFSNFNMWDPEMSGNGLGYPVQRVFNVGVNVKL